MATEPRPQQKWNSQSVLKAWKALHTAILRVAADVQERPVCLQLG